MGFMTEVFSPGMWLLFGLASIVLAGWLPLRRLAPDLGQGEALATGFGLGVLLLTLWMLALSSLGLKFGWLLVSIPPLTASLVLGWVLPQPEPPSCPALSEPAPPYSLWDWVFLVTLSLVLVFAFLRAALYPMWAWDAISTWGFKAKVFYLRGSLDLSGFEAHNYYPNLVPLTLTYLYLWLGQVNDHLVQVVFPAWGVSLLLLLFSLLRRLGLRRSPALGVTTFLALSGVTLITHLYLAYADLALTYYILGAVGFTYIWLATGSRRPWLFLAALFAAGLPWTKFEGLPLSGSLILAALLVLVWFRPPLLGRRLAALGLLPAGMLLGYLPWYLYAAAHGIETGSDHILGFYPHQLLEAIGPFLRTLFHPHFFGLLWPATLLALFLAGKHLLTTPLLFLALYLGGNFLAILLAYAVAPTSPFEFHLYLRATVDRLILHLAPVGALIIGETVKRYQA